MIFSVYRYRIEVSFDLSRRPPYLVFGCSSMDVSMNARKSKFYFHESKPEVIYAMKVGETSHGKYVYFHGIT